MAIPTPMNMSRRKPSGAGGGSPVPERALRHTPVGAGAPPTRGAMGGVAALVRLFPRQLRVYDRSAVYRLAQPLGYWNALAIFTAIGVILALGFAARGRSFATRAISAAILVPLLATFYFTFGRGGWIALGVGLTVMVLIDPRRLQLLATLLVVAPSCVAAISL